MCEVGAASNPLTEAHMDEIAKTVREAWEGVATEQHMLRFFYNPGTPYMTAYDERQVECKWGCVLQDLYSAGESRTAQMFLCRDPSGFTVDVINVHAPSGKKRLTDIQRLELLRNLLQSTSGSVHEGTVGRARCVIGGDMNTAPEMITQLLNVLRVEDVLQTQTRVMESPRQRHGDLCIVGGFTAVNLTMTAMGRDPAHLPYGIRWLATPPLCASRSFWGCCRAAVDWCARHCIRICHIVA